MRKIDWKLTQTYVMMMLALIGSTVLCYIGDPFFIGVGIVLAFFNGAVAVPLILTHKKEL